MLRSALNGHPRVHLAGETHYFDDLRQRFEDPASGVLSTDLAREATDYFCALSHRPYGHHGDPMQGRISPQQLRERAEQLGGTADSYFEAYCMIEAEQAAKSIWGEKTPRHIFRINDILTRFPDAKVVCMSRDPRAVVASYRDWQNQGGFDFERDPGHREALEAEQNRVRRSYHPATISMLWRAQANAALKAREQWGPHKVYLQRYEDLVVEPERELRQLTEWLGLSFEESMLEVPMHNSSYERFAQKQGITRTAVDRWKTKLTPGEIRIVDRICKSVMQSLGYETQASSRPSLSECSLWARWPIAVASAAIANRERSGGLVKYVYRRALLAFGR
jgi:hypothetical protein